MLGVRLQHQCVAVSHDLALAEQVVLEGRVFDAADVIRRDVEKRPHVEGQPVDAFHLVGLRGHLHHQIAHAGVGRLPHHAEEVQGLRRRQIGFTVVLAVEAVAHRGEQCRLPTGEGVQDGLREVRSGRLPLGAGDAGERKSMLRVAVEGRSKQGHRAAHVRDDNAHGPGACRIIGLGHVAAQAGGVRGIKVFRAEAPLAEQQGVRIHRPRVVADGGEDRRLHMRQPRGGKCPPGARDDLAQQPMLAQNRDRRRKCECHNRPLPGDGSIRRPITECSFYTRPGCACL